MTDGKTIGGGSPRAVSAARVSPRPELGGLRAYAVQWDAPVRLNQNESPLDWPADLKAEVVRRVARAGWNRYPAAQAEILRQALAGAYGLAPEMVALTNGSDEAILALVEAFAGGRTVVLPVPTYSMAEPLAIAGGARVVPVPLRPDFSLDAAAVIRASREVDAGLILLVSPNNPTGNAFAPREVETVVREAACLVAVDEAYADFAAGSWLPQVPDCAELAVVRTFSKAFAFAGGRVGWIAAAPEVVAAVRAVLPPYNLNIFAQEAAMVALEHRSFFQAQAAALAAERERLRAAMAALERVTVFPSQTNFLLFSAAGFPSRILFDRLLARGVLVRDVSSAPLLADCLRVTVGTADENARFLEALRQSLTEGLPIGATEGPPIGAEERQ